MNLKKIAELVSGQLIGDQNLEIASVEPLAQALSGSLAFILEEKSLALALKSKASAFVTFSADKLDNKNLIVVKNPREAMAKILALFAPPKKEYQGISETALVPKSCQIGKNVYLGPFVTLGENVSIGNNTKIFSHVAIGDNVSIGNNCTIYPQTTIYDQVKIGNRVILHAGVCLGVDGFGYAQENGQHIKIPQIGTVIIEDDVELFANVCISRATLGSTIIGAGTKIDSLTHIAHNCIIGKDCAIVSLVGIAGSVTLKDRVYVGGQAGFNGHITIGENTVVLARSGVTKDIPANSFISGFPAQEHKKEIAAQASLRRLAKKQHG